MMSLKTLALSLFLLTLTTRTIRADDLGESDDAYVMKQHSDPRASKLKQEQFALVNAQTVLNHVTKNRKIREDKLSKKLRIGVKEAVEAERLDLKADEQKYQQDANSALKETTEIDKFLANDKNVNDVAHKKLAIMKNQADATVHDEFIATSAAQKTMGHFKQFVGQATGLVDSLHNADLRRAMEKQPDAQKAQKGTATKAETPMKADDAQSEQNPRVPYPNDPQETGAKVTPEEKERASIDRFVEKRDEKRERPQRTSGPHIDDTQVQPTKERAMKAMAQEKRDEKNAAAYGRRMEAKDAAKAGNDMPDELGSGSHRAPQLDHSFNNPQASDPVE